jgi:hypothetical protein
MYTFFSGIGLGGRQFPVGKERAIMTNAKMLAAVLAAVVVAGGACARAADEVPAVTVQEESQWEKFKEGAKIAGGAVVQGTKNTAAKVAEESKKAGHAIAETYDDAKGYVKEKME